jgi:prepilin-type N-terminal cleavage/methylation domain-containing protein
MHPTDLIQTSIPATSRSAATTISLSFQVSALRPPRKASGFTLIELLVVIAIIAILAGLAFPAVQGALGSGRKAQARNDVAQLTAAIKAFQLEYGRLPVAPTGTGDLTNAPNASVISALTSSNDLNPRGITFIEVNAYRKGKGGTNSSGAFLDPWGTEYQISLDTSYDNRIGPINLGAGNQTYMTTVIVQSAGPDTNISTHPDNISNVR